MPTPDEQTCSAGLAVWAPGESVDDLVGRADKALYEAKESGRDRLLLAVDVLGVVLRGRGQRVAAFGQDPLLHIITVDHHA